MVVTDLCGCRATRGDRIGRLQAELPRPSQRNPTQTRRPALQELLGGKYNEMSTLGNYMFQSFNFRNREKLKLFYGTALRLPRSPHLSDLGAGNHLRRSACRGLVR